APAEPVVKRPEASIALLFRTEQPALPQRLGVSHSAQPVAQSVKAVRRIAHPEFADPFIRKTATRKIFARQRPFRPAKLLFEKRRCRLVQVQQFSAQPRFCGLFRRRKLPLWQRNPSLLRHHPNRLGKRHILNLAYKREHVARNPAAKAMEELPHGMHRKRRRFFLVKWTQAGIVLRP